MRGEDETTLVIEVVQLPWELERMCVLCDETSKNSNAAKKSQTN